MSLDDLSDDEDEYGPDDESEIIEDDESGDDDVQGEFEGSDEDGEYEK